MKRSLFMALGLIALVGLSACNTWSGLGKDVQKVGKKMEDAGERRR